MKKISVFTILIITMSMLCASCSENKITSSSDNTPAQSSTSNSDKINYDESLWEGYINHKSEEEIVGGTEELSGMHTYNTPVYVVVKVKTRTNNGFSARVLSYKNIQSEYSRTLSGYLLNELNKHISLNDTVKIHFDKNTLLTHYDKKNNITYYTHGTPTKDYLSIGDLAEIVLDKMDDNKNLYSSEISCGGFNEKDIINAS